MTFSQKIVYEAKKAVNEGYKPPAKPACAYFASEMIKRAGWTGKTTAWVPDFFDLGTKLKSGEIPQGGDLIIFWGTYDAVAPAGIGREDDKTHVGIMISDSNFVHYSASADRPVIQNFEGYWKEHFEAFIRLKSDETNTTTTTTAAVEKKTSNKAIKLFWHPAAANPKAVIDEKEIEVSHIWLTIRTADGREILLTSHPYQQYPALTIDGKNFPVKYIGANGFY